MLIKKDMCGLIFSSVSLMFLLIIMQTEKIFQYFRLSVVKVDNSFETLVFTENKTNRLNSQIVEKFNLFGSKYVTVSPFELVCITITDIEMLFLFNWH